MNGENDGMSHLSSLGAVLSSRTGQKGSLARRVVGGVCIQLGQLIASLLFMCVTCLTGAKRREWMGCWGAGMMTLLVIMDHSRKFPAFSTLCQLCQLCHMCCFRSSGAQLRNERKPLTAVFNARCWAKRIFGLASRAGISLAWELLASTHVSWSQ